jgi:hypothetical protein
MRNRMLLSALVVAVLALGLLVLGTFSVRRIPADLLVLLDRELAAIAGLEVASFRSFPIKNRELGFRFRIDTDDFGGTRPRGRAGQSSQRELRRRNTHALGNPGLRQRFLGRGAHVTWEPVNDFATHPKIGILDRDVAPAHADR